MKLWDDLEPVDEMRALYAEWLAERPPHVRAVAERFDPWTVYRLKTTGQACRFIGCDEGAVSCGEDPSSVPPERVTVRALCCHPALPWEIAGRQVFGLDPDDFELWPDDEPHESEMQVVIGAPILVEAGDVLWPDVPEGAEGGYAYARGASTPILVEAEIVHTNDALIQAVRCRRCTDCVGQDHHWLDGSIDPDDAESVAEFKASHPGVLITEDLLLAHEECKHCPAVRPWQDPEEETDDDDEA